MKPKGPVELVDDGIEMMRRDAALLLGVTAITSLPLGALGFASAGDGIDATDDRFSLPSILASAVVLTVAAATAAVADDVRRSGGVPTVTNTVPVVLRRLHVLVGAWVVVHALMVLGLVTGGIVSLVVVASSVPVTAIVMIERGGPVGAFRRSWALTKGARWMLLAHVLVIAVLSGVVTLSGFFFVGLVGEVSIGASSAAFGIMGIVTGAVTQSVVGASSVAVYRDLRRVHEGTDLVDRVERMNV